jgi:hypothetical protein
MRGGMQAELGALAQDLIGRDVPLNGGKFNAVKKRLAQLFFAFKSQNIERDRQAMDD